MTALRDPDVLRSDDLLERLQRRFAQPLPGPLVHRRFAHELSFGRHSGPPPADARDAAVLVLLYPADEQWHLPLLLRPTGMAAHGGQVAFPGGMAERGETPEQCAAREAQEELGIDPARLNFLGRLTPLYIYASNFRVTVCVAGTSVRPAFRPDASEVAELLQLPVEELWNDQRIGRHAILRQGVQFEVPHLEFQGRRIWGATRMMLGELQCLLDDVRYANDECVTNA